MFSFSQNILLSTYYLPSTALEDGSSVKKKNLANIEYSNLELVNKKMYFYVCINI